MCSAEERAGGPKRANVNTMAPPDIVNARDHAAVPPGEGHQPRSATACRAVARHTLPASPRCQPKVLFTWV